MTTESISPGGDQEPGKGPYLPMGETKDTPSVVIGSGGVARPDWIGPELSDVDLPEYQQILPEPSPDHPYIVPPDTYSYWLGIRTDTIPEGGTEDAKPVGHIFPGVPTRPPAEQSE